MEDGIKDIGALFNRVTALEQDDLSTEESLVNIVKGYGKIGIRTRLKIRLHQYPIAGDQSPLIGAVASPDLYI